MKQPKTFWIVVKDTSKNIFNLHGPISDDTEWNNAVFEAGYPIQCETPDGNLSEREVIDQMAQIGYKPSCYTILEPPKGRSAAVYSGALPQYAQNANRNRVVRIICRGDCRRGQSSWAEMSIDYPGEAALREMDSLQVTARCLKCGYEAKDPYNWTR